MTDDTSREKGLELGATANHTTNSSSGRWEEVQPQCVLNVRVRQCVCNKDEMLGMDASPEGSRECE